MVPFGFLLRVLTASQELAAVLLNSFFGATGVALVFLFFKNLTQKYFESLLLVGVFGMSISQLVFGSIPETYALTTCSIIASYILLLFCLQQQRVYSACWLAARLFSFGVTITNFAQTVICSVVLLFALVTDSSQFITVDLSLSQPWLLFSKLFKHFLGVSFVSPAPFINRIAPETGRSILSFFAQPLDYKLLGWAALTLWLVLSILGLLRSLQANCRSALLSAAALAVLFNMSLHTVFGTEELFLYTCNFTFPVLLLVVNPSLLKRGYFTWSLTLLIVLMGSNNLIVLGQIAAT
ncbi:hypothetical protein H6F94_24735 [Leptolyngbya sp. FACHB-261]|nr:hypothetical protein [Leptolyngbya sp. FACHB-261]